MKSNFYKYYLYIFIPLSIIYWLTFDFTSDPLYEIFLDPYSYSAICSAIFTAGSSSIVCLLSIMVSLIISKGKIPGFGKKQLGLLVFATIAGIALSAAGAYEFSKNQRINQSDMIEHYGNDMILYAIFAFIAVIMLAFSVMPLTIKPSDTENKEKSIMDLFSVAFFSVSCLISAICIAIGLFYGDKGSHYPDLFQLMTIQVGGTLLTAVLVGLLVTNAFIFSNRNKFTAILFSVIALLLLCILPTLLKEKTEGFDDKYVRFHRYMENLARYEESTKQKDVVRVEEVYSEEDEPEDETFQLSFLWQIPENDADSIDIALKYVVGVFDMGSLIYHYIIPESNPDSLIIADDNYFFHDYNYGYEKEKGEAEYKKIFNYLSKFRNDINIVALFNSYKWLIYETITPRIYIKSEFDVCAEILTRAYDDLYRYEDEIGDNFENFEKIYDIMKGDERLSYNTYYNRITPFISEENMEHYSSEENSMDEETIVWAYSFWGRRYSEGNLTETAQILYTIRRHYEGDY